MLSISLTGGAFEVFTDFGAKKEYKIALINRTSHLAIYTFHHALNEEQIL